MNNLLFLLISSIMITQTIYSNDDIFIPKLETEVFDNLSDLRQQRFLKLEDYEYINKKNDKNYKFSMSEANLPIFQRKMIGDLKNTYNFTHSIDYIDYISLKCKEGIRDGFVDLRCVFNKLKFENFNFRNKLINIYIDELNYHEKKTLINYNYFLIKESDYILSNQYNYYIRNKNKVKKDTPRNYYENISNKEIKKQLKDNLFNYLIRIGGVEIFKTNINGIDIEEFKINNFSNIVNLLLSSNMNFYNKERNIKMDIKLKKIKVNKITFKNIPLFLLNYINSKIMTNNIEINIDMSIIKENNQLVFKIKNMKINDEFGLLDMKSSFSFSLNLNNYLKSDNPIEDIIFISGDFNFNLTKLNYDISGYFKRMNYLKNGYIRSEQNKLDLSMIRNFLLYDNFLNITKKELYQYILPFIRFEQDYLNISIENKNLLGNNQIIEEVKTSYQENINLKSIIEIEYDFKKYYNKIK